MQACRWLRGCPLSRSILEMLVLVSVFLNISVHLFFVVFAPIPSLWSRDITLPTKVCIFKAVFIPVVMYRCDGCTIKKAECQRIDAFELWCWRRLWRVPWRARRSHLKEINSEYSLERLILKMKL